MLSLNIRNRLSLMIFILKTEVETLMVMLRQENEEASDQNVPFRLLSSAITRVFV
jgi:hypothetical protein